MQSNLSFEFSPREKEIKSFKSIWYPSYALWREFLIILMNLEEKRSQNKPLKELIKSKEK